MTLALTNTQSIQNPSEKLEFLYNAIVLVDINLGSVRIFINTHTIILDGC